MRAAFHVYEWVAPAILSPLSFWLWWGETAHHLTTTLLIWGLPVLWAYIVPGVGANVLGMWEFDTRMRLGRFRLQHGFVFGSATSLIAWLVHGGPAQSLLDVLRLSFVLASVLGFWNLLYDIKALEVGILRVYNQPWADGQPAAAIALDYAPWFFAGFGAVYGALIGVLEIEPALARSTLSAWAVLAASLAAGCALPTAGYVLQSLRRHGHSGTRPLARQPHDIQEGTKP